MAFDYGTKRIGIAVTDPMQIIATGLDTIHPQFIVDYLKKYLLTEQVERFIVGEPKQMDNTPSQSAVHVKGFVTILKRISRRYLLKCWMSALLPKWHRQPLHKAA